MPVPQDVVIDLIPATWVLWRPDEGPVIVFDTGRNIPADIGEVEREVAIGALRRRGAVEQAEYPGHACSR